jgi:Starch-binding associating with outer membrane
MYNKSLKKITALTGIALLVLGTSCNKLQDFGDTNSDPAAVTSAIPYALLTNAEWQLGAFASNARATVTCQYASEAEYPTFGLYAVPQVDFGATYSSVLFDLQSAIGNSTNPAEIAMARILKAYIYWTITDRWGNIPYETALQGKIPTYSKQEFIYKDMIKELTEAVAQMPASGSQRGDIMYNSDFSKWKKLGNSLRMLMALRLSKVYPGSSDYAATEFKAALNDGAGSIDDNSANFAVNYVGGGGDGSPYSNQYWYNSTQLRDLGLSKPLFDMLSAVSDPRTSVFGSSTTAVPYG